MKNAINIIQYLNTDSTKNKKERKKKTTVGV